MGTDVPHRGLVAIHCQHARDRGIPIVIACSRSPTAERGHPCGVSGLPVYVAQDVLAAQQYHARVRTVFSDLARGRSTLLTHYTHDVALVIERL